MSGIYRAEFPRVWQTELTRVADGVHACGRRSSRVRQTGVHACGRREFTAF